MGDHHAQDVASTGAHGYAHADFAATLGYSVRDLAVKPDRGQHHGNQSKAGNEPRRKATQKNRVRIGDDRIHGARRDHSQFRVDVVQRIPRGSEGSRRISRGPYHHEEARVRALVHGRIDDWVHWSVESLRILVGDDADNLHVRQIVRIGEFEFFTDGIFAGEESVGERL